MKWRHAKQPTRFPDGETMTFHPDIVYDEEGEDQGVCMVYGIPLNTTLEALRSDKRSARPLPYARLIAAAPELLEALKAALVYIEGAYEWIFPDHLENARVLADARAAIEKAEGRE